MSRRDSDPRIIHARAIKSHHVTSTSSLNNLITLYSKANLRHYSLRIFNTIPTPNVVSWSSLISVFSHSTTSFHHFISMLRGSTLPTTRTLANLFRTCASLASFSFALQLHSVAQKLSLNSDPFTASAVVSLYSKAGIEDDACKAFDEMGHRDEVCYCSIINGFAQNGRPFEALCYFGKMIRDGVGSRIHSVSGALKAVSELAMLEQCKIIHGHAVVTGWNSNVIIGTALIDAYGKCGFVEDARGVFNELVMVLSIIGWNVMMAGYARQGDKDHVLELFGSMKDQGLHPDNYSFLAVLTALYNAGSVGETQRWFRKMKVHYQLDPGIEHYTCLIGSLGRAGRLEEALRVALAMGFEPDAAVWRLLLSCSAYHRNTNMAQKMSQKLLQIVPDDDSAHVILLNAFASAERWDDVKDIMATMKENHVKKASGRSWIEVRGEFHEFLAGDRIHERKDEIYKKLALLMEDIEQLQNVLVGDEILHTQKREGRSALDL